MVGSLMYPCRTGARHGGMLDTVGRQLLWRFQF
ncbi:hypothetical protein CCACVL1_24605 [Corchorus capsularis]|uniref:Uncharacterized protein n=1 Tax=Corchorus capsularis TaxID=210143 RepID=A0A1R3GP09_COCAP|nr:hypothetical protein CCACVL1_24605 [Corchorus capsularis]